MSRSVGGVFQSLLWWNDLADIVPAHRRRRPHRVSILVVVERPRRRHGDDARRPHGAPVSILVVVERPRRPWSWLALGWSRREFQSLLWWNDLADPAGRPRPSGAGRCFNPCCGGTTSPTGRTLLYSLTPYGRFQSLLWWNDLADGRRSGVQAGRPEVSILVVVERPRRPPPVGRGHGPSTGFNPCCGGTTSPTPPIPGASTPFLEFQSLLWWNDLADPRKTSPIGPRKSRFQSLLWWNDLADRGGGGPGGGGGGVSILVVVERPRRRDDPGAVAYTFVLFQSLLWWNDLADLTGVGS